jgi:hypothetical protein
MRYYFHVLSYANEYRDEEGVTCAGPGDAERHAFLMANEIYRLLGDEFRRDERIAAISVQVTETKWATRSLAHLFSYKNTGVIDRSAAPVLFRLTHRRRSRIRELEPVGRTP